MEQQWTKKRVMRLNQADEAVIEQWLDEYIHVIYTWQYYQVGADAEISADLTSRTFKRAVESLSTFNPDAETMLEWLRGQGRQVRDEVLEIRQIKPQRPWAWSQLPDSVLCGLSHLRDEPLSEDVTNNPFVREIIQAALAEMEADNRDMMMRRFNHLNTAEHIAAEAGRNVGEINDRLYRCRHTFRRSFIHIIQSANIGFSESTAPGNLDLLDANLEKLLSSTNMVLTVSPKEYARTREIVLAAAAVTSVQPSTGQPRTFIAAGSGAVLLLILLVIGLSVWMNPPAETPVTPEREIVSTESNPAPSESKPEESELEGINQAELERVLMLGQTGDLAGLLDILKNGQFTSQIAAAHFIARFGDEAALGMLEEAQMRWYPNGPENNPFAEAILQIEERLLAESGVIIEEPNESDTLPVNQETAPPPTPKASIQGTVRDGSGNPLANAQITLSANPLYGNAADGRMVAQTVTNETGIYQIPNPPPGAYFIDYHGMENSVGLSRAVWCQADTAYTVDFGGQGIVAGVLIDGLSETAGQVCYLSDTLEPTNASFRGESVTDGEGRFLFTGIAPGSYYLLNGTNPDAIVWVQSMDVQTGGLTEREVNVKRAALVVSMEADEDAATPYEIFLTYGPDVSDQMQQFPLLLQDDGRFMSDSIPFGSYTLVSLFESGMRLQQPLELNADRELRLTAPAGEGMLSGLFTNPTPYSFFLYSTDQRVRFDLGVGGDGAYVFEAMPADTYTLAAVVNGLQLEFMDIDLQAEPEQMLDIDAGQLLGAFSPLYVAVTGTEGTMLSSAQVWVTGTGEVVTTQSTGRGAFLALPPGEYSLFAALPGYPTAEEVIQVREMPLQTPPNPDNTIRLHLKAP